MKRARAGMTLLALIAGILAWPASAAIDPGLLHGLKARSIGPSAVGGRIAAIDADPNHVIIGAAALREAARSAGVGLLSPAAPVSVPE